MDWPDEPATEQQVDQLKKLGYMIARPLTLTQAASLIRQYKKGPPRPVSPAPPQPEVPPAGSSAGKPGLPAAPAREGGGEMSRTQGRPLQAQSEPPAHFKLARPETTPPAAEAAAAKAVRVEFWLDTFREVKEMRVGSAQVYELRQKHGCRFLLPSSEQVRDLLDALDAAMPLWDKEHPEVFYQTLQLNFPDLTRGKTSGLAGRPG